LTLEHGAPELILALETACRRPSVALLRGREVLAEVDAPEGRTGAESLLPGVDSVLRRASATLRDIEGFAVSIGPGSFTGLRVGVATVKGLCFGSGRPVAEVPTLAAVCAGAATTDEPMVAMLDAQRGEVYAALYRAAGPDTLPEAGDPVMGVYTPEELAPRLPERCRLVGEGLAVCGERLRELGGPQIVLGEPRAARAVDVGRLGQLLLARGEAVSAAALAPRYLRRAQAEVDRTGERFE
jgi:tRNA threonylcarbamoyladenosine biosynthesis protein TsaB